MRLQNLLLYVLIPVALIGLAEFVIVTFFLGSESEIALAKAFSAIWAFISVGTIFYTWVAAKKSQESTETECEELRKANKTFRNDMESLRDKVRGFDLQKDALMDKIGERDRDIEQRTLTVEDLRTELALLKKESEAFAEQKREYERRLEELEDGAGQKLKALEADLRDAEIRRKQLLEDLEEKERGFNRMQRDYKELGEQYEVCKKAKVEVEEELEAKAADLASLQQRLDAKLREVAEKEARIESIYEEVSDLENKHDELKEQLVKSEISYEARVDEIRELKSRIDTLEEELKDLEAAGEKLRNASREIAELEAEKERLLSENDHLVNTVHELEDTMENQVRESHVEVDKHVEWTVNHFGKDDSSDPKQRCVTLNWRNRGADIHLIHVKTEPELDTSIEMGRNLKHNGLAQVLIEPKKGAVLPDFIDVEIQYALHNFPFKLSIDRKKNKIERKNKAED